MVFLKFTRRTFYWSGYFKQLWFYRDLLAIVTIYVILAVVYSVVVPLGAGPDEVDHLRFINFLVENHHLPTNSYEQTRAGVMSIFSPLYHVLVATITTWADTAPPPALKVLRYGPREQLVTDYIYARKFLQTADMEMPYKGTMLLWHLSRFVSVALSLGIVIVTYFIALELFPHKKYLAATAAATIAFLPRFIFISAVVNNDVLVGLLVALSLWLLIKIVKGSDTPQIFIGLGMLIGLSLSTKFSVVFIPIVFVLVLAWVSKSYSNRWLGWTWRVLGVGVVATIFFGWFLVYIAWYFNEIETLGPVFGVISPLIPQVATNFHPIQLIYAGVFGNSSTIGSLSEAREPFTLWLITFFQSFWAEPLPTGHPLSPHIFIVVLLWLGIIGTGLWRVWRQQKHQQQVWMVILLLYVLALVPLILFRYYFSGSIIETAQGRHVALPAASAVGILLAWGWATFAGPTRKKWIVFLLPVFLFGWSVAYLFFVKTFYPPVLPVYTNPEVVSRVKNQVGETFADTMELVGYNLDVQSNRLVLELMWRSLQYANDDYLIEISLADESGQLQRQWVGHQGGELYPTRAWEPGEVICDTIHLPLAGFVAGNYQLQMRLLRAYRWPTEAISDPFILTNVTLAETPLLSDNRWLTVPTADKEINISYKLWQPLWTDLFRSSYGYRSTISLIWQAEWPDDANLDVYLSLVGPDDQTWLPKVTMGQLSNFIVEAGWAPGAYRLRGEVWENGSVIGVAESEPILSVENIQRQFDIPAIAYRLDANFAGQVVLLGYDLPSRRVKAGESLPITVYWQSLQTMGHSLVMFNNLLDANQREWGGYDRRPQDIGDTILWVPGEVITDGYVIPVAPEAPDGIYYLQVGLYLPLEESVLTLPLMQAGQMSDVTHLTLGPIKIGGPPPGVTVSNPQPQYSRADILADVIRLGGYDLSVDAFSRKIHLTLYWQCLTTMEKKYTVFAHLRDRQGQIIAQSDSPPAAGAYPTSLWDPGEIIVDKVTLLFPDDASLEDSTLIVGMYDFATGTRLAVSNASDDSIILNLD